MEPAAINDAAKELPGLIELIKSGGSVANFVLIWIALKIRDYIKDYLDLQKRMHEENARMLKQIHVAVGAKRDPGQQL